MSSLPGGMVPTNPMIPPSQASPNRASMTTPLASVGSTVLPSRLTASRISTSRTISPTARVASPGW